MRGGTTAAIGWVILELLLLSPVPLASSHRCDRTPEGHVAPKIPADNRFQLKISGSPDKYVPNEGYTISLQGLRSHGQVAAKFTGFMLVVEPQHHIPIRALTPRDVTPRPVGTFQLYGDTLTKFSPSCPNMVTHTSSMPKSEVQVRWTAPPPGSGCVIFRATVIEHRDVWYQDDGPLSKMLCEEVQESHDTQPEVLDQCCACDEAKYEVTFEGLWSRHTHPKDFPSNSWLTRFSDVIGASHSSYYRFWEYGGIASEGLRQVAERGSTRMLESELKSQSQHIRTIIKARGISYPNVTGKTFAVFRVDRVHHLMSLVSMIDPSPDWIVGVSGLELCLRNCSWAESKVLNLYPWDAGTDSGVTYISPDQQTVPRDKIRRITSSFPNDPRSPFYDSSGLEMKPLARLYLTRQRLYEKTCDDDPLPDDPCALTEWGPWSPCSASCGPGNQHRVRNFVKKGRNKCSRPEKLSGRRYCMVQHCRISPQPTDEPVDPKCEVGEWGDWSRCEPVDNLCERGVQKRYRPVNARGSYRKKYCLSIKTAEERDCALSTSFSVCPKNKQGNQVHFPGPQGSTCCDDSKEADEEPDYGTNPVDYGEEEEEPTGECEMTSWSEWSPCSVTCGVGVTRRFRQLKNPPEEGEEPRAEYLRTANNEDDDYGTDDDPEEGFEGENGEGGEQEGEMGEGAEYASGACSLYKTQEVMACNGTYPDCQFTSEEAQPPEEEEEPAEEEEPTDEPGVDGDPGVPPVRNQVTGRMREYEGTERPVVDCKFSRWSPWSKCEAACGQQGYKERTRYIEIHAKNGGKDCTGKTRKQRKCTRKCRHDENEDEEPERSEENRRRHDRCRYSEWSEWSECTATCGYNAVRQRTRQVLAGTNCDDRLRTKTCNVGPCH